MSEQTRRRGGLFPTALSKLTQEITKPALKKRGFAEHRLLTDWPMIAGEECARFTCPIKVSYPRNGEQERTQEAGTLHVEVLSAWALEMQYQQPVILERITQYFGYRAITRIVLHQTQKMHTPLQKNKPDPKRQEHAQRMRKLAESLENQ